MWRCRSYEELLAAAPSDISQADKQAKRQAQQEAAQQLEAARQKVHQLIWQLLNLPSLLLSQARHCCPDPGNFIGSAQLTSRGR